jgi:hypothetical protein
MMICIAKKTFSTLSIILLSFFLATVSTVCAQEDVWFVFNTPEAGLNPDNSNVLESLEMFQAVAMMEMQEGSAESTGGSTYAAPDEFATRQLRGGMNGQLERALPTCGGVWVPSVHNTCTTCKNYVVSQGYGSSSATTCCKLCGLCRRRTLEQQIVSTTIGDISFETTDVYPLEGLNCVEVNQDTVLADATGEAVTAGTSYALGMDPVQVDLKVYKCT